MGASENGWIPNWVDQNALEWVDIPGCNPSVTLQIQKGQPLQILRAYAADYNAYIEPLRDADSDSYTPTNSVSTSNHLNGTAMDLNWNTHPFQVNYAGFDQPMIDRMRAMLAFYEDRVFWAQDWNSPKDTMHHQMGYGTYGDPANQDFINRKIRSDGFSTYQRGDVPVPPPVGDAAKVLARATGLSVDNAAEILPGVQTGLVNSICNNPLRIGMWLAQMGHESAGWQATEEYASGEAYEGRADLGNTEPGDGVRYKGRSWIMVTGRHNYGLMSDWACGEGLVGSPTYFVDDPYALAEIKWAGVGPAWYWVVARPDINDLSDKGDVYTVTLRINGGTNGLQDRQNRYDLAMRCGDDLLVLVKDVGTAPPPPIPPPSEGDVIMSDEMQRMIRDIHSTLFTEMPSRSIYRGSNNPEWQAVELISNNDGFLHQDEVETQARAGNLGELDRVVRTARGEGIVTERWAVARAQRVIAEIEREDPEILRRYLLAKNKSQGAVT